MPGWRVWAVAALLVAYAVLSHLLMTHAPAAPWTIAALFGPLLVSFADWIADQCRARGIHKVYFLARDGLLPYAACSKLFAARGGLACHYIYASRQALHVPGFTDIDSAETWILDPTPFLSLAMIADRAEVPVAVVREAADGLLSTDPDRNVPLPERHLLSQVVRQPVFLYALHAVSATRARDAHAYYQAIGLFGDEPAAIVDIGWNGRLQNSLRKLNRKGEEPGNRVLGLYLCLSKRMTDDPLDEATSFLFEPSDGAEGPLWDRYRSVLEAAMTADHATTTGFERRDDGVHPVFGAPYSPEVQQRVALHREVTNAFIANIASLEAILGRALLPDRKVIVESLTLFVTNPTSTDGNAFLEFDLADGQADAAVQHFVTLRQTARGYLTTSQKLGAWPEGSLAASTDTLLPWAITAERGRNKVVRKAGRILRAIRNLGRRR